MTTRPGTTPIEAVGLKTGRAYTYLAERIVGESPWSLVRQARRLPSAEAAGELVVGKVALKIASGLKARNRLAIEAEMLSRLQRRTGESSRIVRIGAGGEVLNVAATDQWLIELEFLDGRTLADWFEVEWRTSSADALTTVRTASRWVRQLAEALLELSRSDDDDAPILHRDVKPANVMLTSQGVRLFDFNVARPDDEEGDYTECVGTAYFRAPEVLYGRRYDRRADLFSLGVIAWELLAHRKLPVKDVLPDMAEPFVVPWPPGPAHDGAGLASLPPAVADPLARLVTGLLTDQERRLDGPAAVLAILDELDAALGGPARARDGAEALEGLDLIQLLLELRPSGLLAVVADTREQDDRQRVLRRALQVDDRLERWLRRRLERALEADRPSLIVLAGNAGDGKSNLIEQMLDRVGADPRLRYIADATHADKPTETQQGRLEQFFAPFAEGCGAPEKKVSLIAINTGMVIRFFEAAARRRREGVAGCGDLSALYEAMQHQLGLRSPRPPALPIDLEVVNLDLRNLLAAGADGEGAPSFFERMLDRLDPDSEEGLVGYRWADCEACPAASTCPVRFNVEALRLPRVRAALGGFLGRAVLDPEVHLSPRNLWAFLYRLVTGGEERYRREPGERGPCDVVRRHASRGDHGDWLLAGHFSEILFTPLENAPPLWKALAANDPSLVPAPDLDRLQTRLAVQADRDVSDEELELMGGGEGRLAGLSLESVVARLPSSFPASRRRDAAIRRRVFFDPEAFRAFDTWGGCHEYEALLDAYDAYSRLEPEDRKDLRQAHRAALTSLADVVAKVFVQGAGREIGPHRYLRISQPHSRGTSQLFVKIDERSFDDFFAPTKLLVRDAHILAHLGDREREELLRCLAYRPRMVTLRLADHRLVVDLALYQFLLQVRDGRRPSRRDLTQFEALFYLAEHIGNKLAVEQPPGKEELYVLDGATNQLYRLFHDGFGSVSMARYEVAR